MLIPNYSNATMIQVLGCPTPIKSNHSLSSQPKDQDKETLPLVSSLQIRVNRSAQAQLLEWDSDSNFWDPPRQTSLQPVQSMKLTDNQPVQSVEQVQSIHQEGSEPTEPQVKAKLESLQTTDNQPIQSIHQEGPDGTQVTRAKRECACATTRVGQ